MKTTIRDVAIRAGVSPMTVSRVVNDSPRVSEETRRRVKAVIAELEYVPNRVARSLTRKKTGTLGVIVPDVANPFFTLIVRGAEQFAWQAGYHVMLCNTQADIERERRYIEDMISFSVEGLLIAPVGDRSRPHLRMLDRISIPFVLLDRSVKGFECDLVQGDSVGGAQRLTEHLIGLGHTRIAMINERSDISTARDRLRGFREALDKAGVAFLPELVVETSSVDSSPARDAAMSLLTLPERPSAIFAFNNIAVVGVAEAARELSLAIPRDLALVCFDDIEHVSQLFPFLTVMAQPAETFGTIATQLLLERLAGDVSQRRRVVILPPDLVIRESCGASTGGFRPAAGAAVDPP